MILSAVLALLVLVGIAMMSRVRTAVYGNLLSALALLVGVVVTITHNLCIGALPFVCSALLVGALVGSIMAHRVKMIQMPQTVALFNGLGGGASALVGFLSANGESRFVVVTALLAVAVGMITLIGSLVAAGKLHRLLPQQPQVWRWHSATTFLLLLIVVIGIACSPFHLSPFHLSPFTFHLLVVAVASSLFGLYFSVRVGGADMPITISLLNSLSGVAGAIAGMAIGDVFLVAVGGIVGASGLLLTQIMCRAMNRSLAAILLGGRKPKTTATPTSYPSSLIQRVMDLEKKIQELEELVRNLESRVQSLSEQLDKAEQKPASEKATAMEQPTAGSVLSQAKDVIIVPGYGMALAQAQHQVRQLADRLQSNGARVRFAIHPVAGRMPGHMNVLLAEVDIDYEQLYELEAINDDFAKCDAVVVIGANDVLNPAAREAEGTPIYGMPVFNVDKAPEVIICNFDLKPGYAGVENPLYTRKEGVFLLLGDAKESLMKLIGEIKG